MSSSLRQTTVRRKRRTVWLSVAMAAISAWQLFAGVTVLAEEKQLSPAESAAKLETFRQEIVTTRTNVFFTLIQLDEIRRSSDPQLQFQKFTNQLARIQERAAYTRELAKTLKQKGDAYFKAWEARITGTPDSKSRQQAAAGYDRRKESYDRIVKSMQKAGADFPPFVSTMREIQHLLQGKPTREEVAAAKDLFTKANWQCADVQRSLMEVEKELETITADITRSNASPGTQIPDTIKPKSL